MFLLSDYDIYAAPDRGAEYCDDRVCLSVCVCVCLSISETSSQIFANICACYMRTRLGSRRYAEYFWFYEWRHICP